MKYIYISFIRSLRSVLRITGFLSFLEKRMVKSRWVRWFRSLFAIYDFDDLVGLDLPWWNLRAVEWVSDFTAKNTNLRAFEYGSGASSIWLSKRCSSVVTVEHDAEWAALVRDKFADVDNIKLRAIPPSDTFSEEESGYLSQRADWLDRSFKEYAVSIKSEGNKFDIIVIDGRVRGACLKEAREFLSDRGIIIFDNAGRDRYQKAIDESGLEKILFSGLTACLPYADETCILKRV